MINIQNILLILLVALAPVPAYLLLLTLAAWLAKPKTQINPSSQETLPRFVFLIPAHNEEILLPECLESLGHIDYPADRYHVLVVADNCQDQTAGIAHSFGALVTERVNSNLRGKGYALDWGLEHLRQTGQRYEAVVILDADTTVSGNFLRVMAARLERGERIIQAYYSVRNADHSWSENMRYAALTVLHYLRPQGRMVLGGSAGLKGNGMVFTRTVLERRTWSASVTEDIEFHMQLLLDGERVMFAPDASVWGEMPDSLPGARSQLDRWEQGRIEMARRYIPRLINAALRAVLQQQGRRAFVLIDAVMEHLIPPFSLMMGLSLLAVMVTIALFIIGPSSPAAIACLVTSFAILLSQLFYLFSGLIMAKAPAAAYQALAYAPLFIVWKIWQYLSVLFHHGQQEWVRTTRNGG